MVATVPAAYRQAEAVWRAALAAERVIPRLAGSRYRAFGERYRHDPQAFVHDCFDWGADRPAPYQDAILGDLERHRRLAVRGPRGLGKTAVQAWLLWWFALTRDALGTDWKVGTTASVWAQLSDYLWPEIHKWRRRLKWGVIGREPVRMAREYQVLGLRLRHGQAFAASPVDPSAIEGAHAGALLFLFDEAKAIADGVFDAVEGTFASVGDRYVLAASTPERPGGRFHDIHSRKAGYGDWHVRHVTLAEAIAAGRIDPAWVEDRKRQWGEGSALYQNQVLGEFAVSQSEGLVPLAWVEAARARWHGLAARGELPLAKGGVLAVDVARLGDDRTVVAVVRDDVVLALHAWGQVETMETVGRVLRLARRYRPKRIVVDSIGVGAGVYDRLRESDTGGDVASFNAAGRSECRDRSGEMGFANLRAEGWWGLRERLDPAYDAVLALPPDDDLLADLVNTGWRLDSAGRVRIEDKERVRKRLGRSTDAGDAVMMALWTPRIVAPVVLGRDPSPRPSLETRRRRGSRVW